MYEVIGFHKDAERDNWEMGCDPHSCVTYSDNMMRWTAETVPELLEQLAAFLGLSEAEAREVRLLNSCDEVGRVDFQIIENDDGMHPTAAQLKAWKAGEIDLWLATYTFHVERVVREAVDLQKMAA